MKKSRIIKLLFIIFMQIISVNINSMDNEENESNQDFSEENLLNLLSSEFNNENSLNLDFDLGYQNTLSEVAGSPDNANNAGQESAPSNSDEAKSFICNKCNRGFSTSHGLGVHERYHFFECDICKKGFRNGESLKKHKEKGHGPVGIFQCLHEDCNPRFVSNDLKKLLSHNLKNKKIEPFKCDSCTKAFFQHSSFRWHNLMVHEKQAKVLLSEEDKKIIEAEQQNFVTIIVSESNEVPFEHENELEKNAQEIEPETLISGGNEQNMMDFLVQDDLENQSTDLEEQWHSPRIASRNNVNYQQSQTTTSSESILYDLVSEGASSIENARESNQTDLQLLETPTQTRNPESQSEFVQNLNQSAQELNIQDKDNQQEKDVIIIAEEDSVNVEKEKSLPSNNQDKQVVALITLIKALFKDNFKNPTKIKHILTLIKIQLTKKLSLEVNDQASALVNQFFAYTRNLIEKVGNICKSDSIILLLTKDIDKLLENTNSKKRKKSWSSESEKEKKKQKIVQPTDLESPTNLNPAAVSERSMQISSSEEGEVVVNGYKCDFVGCSKTYTTAKNLGNHKKGVHGGGFKCNVERCNQVFKSFRALKYHKKIEHEGGFKCDFLGCKEVFSSETQLIKHRKTGHK